MVPGINLEHNHEGKEAAKQKQISEGNYEAEWKDGKCLFSKEREKFDDQRDNEHDLADEGLNDDYYQRNIDDEDREIEKENQTYLQEEPQFEHQIPSTIVTDVKTKEDYDEEEPAEIEEEEEN